MPSSPDTHSQKSAPGPPSVIAVATPAMFPTPTVDASAVATAWNGVTLPAPAVRSRSLPSTSPSAVPMCRNCTPPVTNSSRTPVPMSSTSIGGPHTIPFSQLLAFVKVSSTRFRVKEVWRSADPEPEGGLEGQCGWARNGEPVRALPPLERGIASQQPHRADRRGQQAGVAAERRDLQLRSRRRHRHAERVERPVTADREAEVARAEAEVGVPASQLAVRCDSQLPVDDVTLAEPHPRLAAVDAVAVDLQPRTDLLEHP